MPSTTCWHLESQESAGLYWDFVIPNEIAISIPIPSPAVTRWSGRSAGLPAGPQHCRGRCGLRSGRSRQDRAGPGAIGTCPSNAAWHRHSCTRSRVCEKAIQHPLVQGIPARFFFFLNILFSFEKKPQSLSGCGFWEPRGSMFIPMRCMAEGGHVKFNPPFLLKTIDFSAVLPLQLMPTYTFKC